MILGRSHGVDEHVHRVVREGWNTKRRDGPPGGRFANRAKRRVSRVADDVAQRVAHRAVRGILRVTLRVSEPLRLDAFSSIHERAHHRAPPVFRARIFDVRARRVDQLEHQSTLVGERLPRRARALLRQFADVGRRSRVDRAVRGDAKRVEEI